MCANAQHFSKIIHVGTRTKRNFKREALRSRLIKDERERIILIRQFFKIKRR